MSISGQAEARISEPVLRQVMPELDTIRGLAVLMVVVYHGFFWQTDLAGFSKLPKLFLTATWVGRLGVNLFFVLSGFLITGLLVDSAGRADYYRRFYWRRALRILPAYYAILVILAITRYSGWPFLGLSAIYLANLTPLFGVAMAYPVLWSLAVEEHFYLLWPTVVRNLRLQSLLICAALIVVASPLVRGISYLVFAKQGEVSFVFWNYTWNSADGLASGALLAVALRLWAWDRRQLLRWSVAGILAGAVLWCVGLPWGIAARQERLVGAALQITPWNMAFTGMLGLFLYVGTSAWRKIVLVPPLRYLGNISYGLYLIHLLVFSGYDWLVNELSSPSMGRFPALTLRFFLVLLVSIGIAHLSRWTFEEYFLQMKYRARAESLS